METSPRRLRVAGLILAAAIFSDHLLAATSPAPETDPFVKKDVPVPASKPEPVYNIIFTVQTYTVGLADGAKLIQENEADRKRYDQVLDLVKNGKAHLTTVMSGAQAPGDQCSIIQVETLRYGDKFDFSPGKPLRTTSYKGENLGDRCTFKSESVSDPSTGELSLFFNSIRLDDFIDQSLNKESTAIISRPRFSYARMNLKSFVPYGKMQFLGTQSFAPPAQPADDSEITLAFGKMDLMPINPGPPTTNKLVVLEHELSLYSVDRDKAVEILNQKQETDSAYQAIQSLVKSGEATLEHLATVRTTNGLKNPISETTEMTYPNTPTGSEMTTQEIGFQAEVTPRFNADSSLMSLDLSTQWPKYRGNLSGQTSTSAYGSQPIFDHSEVITRLNSGLGEHELIGTFNPPPDVGLSGRSFKLGGDVYSLTPPPNAGPAKPKNTDRIWLEFIRTILVNP